jgi:hypothetical protein
MALFKQELEWNRLEPLYIRVYQQSFTQQEIDGFISFYRTPVGQALVKKMPVVLQQTSNEMQSRMTPMMQRIQQMQQEVIAEIQAERRKS